MHEQEFKQLLNRLDDQIESLQKKEESRKKMKQIEEWISTFEDKASQIRALGGVPVVDVEAKIRILKVDRASIAAMLEPASLAEIRSLVGGSTWKDPLPDADAKEILGLKQVIDTFDLAQFTPEQRWFQYESWACQWRIVAGRQGRDMTDQSPLLRQVYGLLRDKMKKENTQLWYIKALEKNQVGDWQLRFQECEAEIRRLDIEEAEKDNAHDNVQTEAIYTLQATVSQAFEGNPSEDFLRILGHQIRQAARFKHLRDEIAVLVEPLREYLPKDFDFLWPTDEIEEVIPAKSMSNREILSRLMRRMKAKTLIGACHGPFEQIYKGFPDQDKGRAKELLEFLAKVGVIRAKSTKIGLRISIEPKMIPVADRLIEMEETGLAPVDEVIMSEAKI